MKDMKRLATLVGCNYTNTKYELHGCINDVHAMHDMLVKRFGFKPGYIELLTDHPGSSIMPTGTNIRRVLRQMIDQAEPGDVLYFHYSGHGTWMPSKRHCSKHDEAIVPCDFNLITDVDFRQLVKRLPEGASFTILSDSCHSGGLIDKEKEQIGPHVTANVSPHRHKAIPFHSVLDHLTTLSGIVSTDIGIHLLEVFGSEASAKFQTHDVELDTLKPVKPDNGILLSGCQANETSADLGPASNRTLAHGAFSNAVQSVLMAHNGPISNRTLAHGAFSNAVQSVLMAHNGPISNRELVKCVREILHKQGIQQHPCLYCSDKNVDAPFLSQLAHTSK